jgi:aminoglycoside phosphotransferase (APT) family kinase protein
MPRAEVVVDVARVRSLLATAAPRWAELPLREVARGWDNAVYRLGDDLAVRVPLRAVAAPLIDHEARWLPELAPRLPIATPVPVLVGEPAIGYPWRWAVVPWVDGQVLAEVPVADRTRYAAQLADVLVALHRPAPAAAPENRFRGVPLTERATTVDVDWSVLAARHPSVSVWALEEAWRRGLAADPWPGPPLWLHGDPHPLNLVVAGDRLAGLIDFGDVTSGDPASDLATTWMTFDAAGREPFRLRVDAAGVVDAAVWDRAAAWAARIATALLRNHVPGEALYAVASHTAAELAGG